MTPTPEEVRPTFGRARGYWSQVGHKMLRNKTVRAGVIVLGIILLPATLAPIVAPADPLRHNDLQRLAGPSLEHLMGTDDFGRDILSRLLYGARDSVGTALLAVAVGAVIGIALGMLATVSWKAFDIAAMRITDVGLAFPAVIVGIMVVTLRGPGNASLISAVAIYNVPIFARLTRSLADSVTGREFVEAATLAGVRRLRMIRQHILPNVSSPLLVQFGVAVPVAILLVAGLSFLGLGAQPPTPSLGGMLSDSRAYLNVAPWYAVFPGICLSLVIGGLNLVADGMREALDPEVMVSQE